MLILSSLIQFLKIERRIFAYDSFSGFPEPTKEDISWRQPTKGEWDRSPSGKYEYNEVFCKRVLSEGDVDISKIDMTLVKGYFENTLPISELGEIALLNIDGDLYNSYYNVLKYLYKNVTRGGVILFDDFSKEDDTQPAFPGARKATKDFLGDELYNKIKLNKYGVYYLIKE